MKQKFFDLTLILSFLLFSFSLVSCSDDDEPGDGNVPQSVLNAFNAKYPGVTDVKWDVVQGYRVARFNKPSRATVDAYSNSAWFTIEGAFCQEDEDIDYKDLPEVVKAGFEKYKQTFYPTDWVIDDCEVLERQGMGRIYVIEIENGDLEREISVSEMGDILKDVLDDDDDDDILPVIIPDEIYAALEKVFPKTHSTLTILELEIDDDEIEIDVIEDGRHKEVELNALYELVSIEYEVSVEEASKLMKEDVFLRLVEMAKQAGFDIFDEAIQKNIEIEVKQSKEGFAFEIEIEVNGKDEFEIEIDENGNFIFEED